MNIKKKIIYLVAIIIVLTGVPAGVMGLTNIKIFTISTSNDWIGFWGGISRGTDWGGYNIFSFGDYTERWKG